MSRFRRDHCYLHRLSVPDFADQDHFGRLTQSGAKAFGEIWEILSHFTMSYRGAGVRMHKFDWVFQGENMNIGCLIQLVDHGGERSAFSAAGSAGDENDTVFFFN